MQVLDEFHALEWLQFLVMFVVLMIHRSIFARNLAASVFVCGHVGRVWGLLEYVT